MTAGIYRFQTFSRLLEFLNLAFKVPILPSKFLVLGHETIPFISSLYQLILSVPTR